MAGLATGLAIAGLAISAGTTAVSFIQAGQSRRKQQEYEAEADKAMAEARRQLQVNYAKQMSIKKEPYAQERLAMLSQGQQVVDAASESDRGAASAAGQVLMGQQVGQADITNRQGTDLQNIENAILEEESRLRDINVDLDMQEVEGQMAAAADMRTQAAQQTQEGIQGIANTAQAGLSMIPLYSQNMAAQEQALGGVQLTSDQFQQVGNVGGDAGSKIMGAAGTDGFTNLDLGMVGDLTNKQYRQFKRELTPQQRQMLFQNPQYAANYQNVFNPIIR
jgi:hypothetical protein